MFARSVLAIAAATALSLVGCPGGRDDADGGGDADADGDSDGELYACPVSACWEDCIRDDTGIPTCLSYCDLEDGIGCYELCRAKDVAFATCISYCKLDTPCAQVLCWELCAAAGTATPTCESYCGHAPDVCETCEPAESSSEACMSTCLDAGTSTPICSSYCEQ